MDRDRAFGFVQFEHAGRLGPEPGRYVVRRYAGDEAQQVLVIGGTAPAGEGLLGAGGRRRRRPRRAAPGSPAADAEVTRLTVVDAVPLADPDAWLRRTVRDDHAIAAAARLVNRALAAYRLGSADPYVADVSPSHALAVRVGYGAGEAVAEGRWTAARELPTSGPGARRSALLQPQERLAALLGGRDAALVCEELALRARLDLDQGREREATLVTEAALRVACAELAGWRETPGMAERVEELGARRALIAPIAEAAVQGGLPASERAAVSAALERLEAALRARLADSMR